MTPAPQAASAAAPRLLIVDDDPAVREALKKVLQESGYDVVAAPDGRQGILRLEEQEFQLLLLDLDLPEVSGWDILELAMDRWPLLPVIILTAFRSQCVPGSLLGTDAVLEKPPDVSRLLNTVAGLLGEPAETRLKRRIHNSLGGTASPPPHESARRLAW